MGRAMKGGRKKGKRLPTALPEEFAAVADQQAKHWTAIGTIGRALMVLEPRERVKVLRALLKELEP